MTRFGNTPTLSRRPSRPVVINQAGGESYQQSPKLELASLLVTSFVQDKYYRSGSEEVKRLYELLDQVDPLFAAKAAKFARDEFGMRSISHIVAGELAARVKGEQWTRPFYKSVVIRPDDIIEILSYYLAVHGKPIPNPLKDGLAKAFDKFDRYQIAKYRKDTHAFSLVDAVNLLHPKPTDRNADALADLVAGTLRNEATWEAQQSIAGQEMVGATQEERQEAKADVWAGLIEEGRMPYMALVKNLRNILKTGDRTLIAKAATQLVEDSPGDHRVLPFRYIDALNAIREDNVAYPGITEMVSAISTALDISFKNVPQLDGDTLIAVDGSGSMAGFGYSKNQRRPLHSAALFAAALYKASKNPDLVVFSSNSRNVVLNPADSTLTIADQIVKSAPRQGTNFHSVFEWANKPYDRIVFLSDEQGWIGYRAPTGTLREYEKTYQCKPYIYSIDVAGYGNMQFPEDRILATAGFSEKTFDIMGKLEADRQALVNRIEQVQFN